jgi:hypothetical protein
MSLNVYLKKGRDAVYSANITHNLGKMAAGCGVYYACWRPDEINAKKAAHILPMLQEGIKLLKEHRKFYESFNSPNGWGTYKNFLPWLEKYAEACAEYPDARIVVSR